VQFGNDVNSITDTIGADQWIQHPDYIDPETFGSDKNDIAVVHMAEPKTDLQPVGLNADAINESWIDIPIQFVGFGITEGGGGGEGLKRTVAVPLVGWTSGEITVSDGYHGTCQGDSGGPGFREVAGGFVQVSVTSRGPASCMENGVHTRVDSYLPWLDELGIVYSTAAASPPGFVCSNRLQADVPSSTAVGVVPFDVRCVLDFPEPDAIDTVSWSWGDGSTGEGPRAQHTYEQEGNFTVRMCAAGENPTGPWNHCVSRVSHVRACDLPDVAFSYLPVEGNTVQFLNETGLRTWGCIFDVQWDIFEGAATTGTPVATLTAWEPQYTFAGKGDYTVVLNVGGPAGTSAASLTMSGTAGASSCSTVGFGGTLGFAGLSLVLMGLRRRQR